MSEDKLHRRTKRRCSIPLKNSGRPPGRSIRSCTSSGHLPDAGGQGRAPAVSDHPGRPADPGIGDRRRTDRRCRSRTVPGGRTRKLTKPAPKCYNVDACCPAVHRAGITGGSGGMVDALVLEASTFGVWVRVPSCDARWPLRAGIPVRFAHSNVVGNLRFPLTPSENAALFWVLTLRPCAPHFFIGGLSPS